MAPNNTDENFQEIETVINENERSQIEEHLKSSEANENQRWQSSTTNQKSNYKSNYDNFDKEKYHGNWISINRDNRNANFDNNRSVSNVSNWSDKSSDDDRNNNWGGKTTYTEDYHRNWLEIKHTFTELSNSVMSNWSTSERERVESDRSLTPTNVMDDSLSRSSFEWPSIYTKLDTVPLDDWAKRVNENYQSIDDLCAYVSPGYSSESGSESGSITSGSTSCSSSVKSYTDKEIEENSSDRYPTIVTVADEPQNGNMIVFNPIIGSSQLLGDGYFLQLCMRYTNYTYTRQGELAPITCGMVQSGLTIKKAIKRLKKVGVMSNKLIVCVGTVDIYCKRSFDSMLDDYKELLEILKTKYKYSKKQVILCTLPPMANLNPNSDKFKLDTFRMFNNWLRYHCLVNHIKLIDFHAAFSKNQQIDFSYYQDFARNVTGTIHPHVLWNYKGRQTAMKLILMA